MINVVTPVFMIAGIGFAARRWLTIDPRAVTRLTLYVFVPALIFNALLATNISGDEIGRIGAFSVLMTIIMVTIGMVGSRALGASRAETSGYTLSIAFANTANYGLPVTLFAFGQEGFDRAAVFATFTAILTFTVAAFVAARGRLPWRDALIPVLKLPVLWAAVAAAAFRLVGFDLPVPVQRAVTTLAGGAIPVIILLLGIQVAGMGLKRVRLPVFVACAARLIVAPAIGLVLVALLQPSPLTAKVLVLEAAMPTAVNVALLASEFDAEPDLVSSITLLTTIFSLATVTIWVAILQSM